jgi:hypothetical protein
VPARESLGRRRAGWGAQVGSCVLHPAAGAAHGARHGAGAHWQSMSPGSCGWMPLWCAWSRSSFHARHAGLPLTSLMAGWAAPGLVCVCRRVPRRQRRACMQLRSSVAWVAAVAGALRRPGRFVVHSGGATSWLDPECWKCWLLQATRMAAPSSVRAQERLLAAWSTVRRRSPPQPATLPVTKPAQHTVRQARCPAPFHPGDR